MMGQCVYLCFVLLYSVSAYVQHQRIAVSRGKSSNRPSVCLPPRQAVSLRRDTSNFQSLSYRRRKDVLSSSTKLHVFDLLSQHQHFDPAVLLDSIMFFPFQNDAVVSSPAQLARPVAQYAPAATSLFDNMKTPASILAAGMISLGFVAQFPTLEGTRENPPSFPPAVHERWKTLKRIHIVISLISFCSELLAVMWATVAVNKLTETAIEPAYSVWDLLQRDCDLFWAATNSHFVLGMIGFMGMVGLRGYVMLLAEEASAPLMAAALSGIGAAFCLLISVVNRGVQSGGGDGVGYGDTIFALFQHYGALLYQQATRVGFEGPLEISSIVLEAASVAFAMTVIVTGNYQAKPNEQEDEDFMVTAAVIYEMEEDTDDEEYVSTFHGESSLSTVHDTVFISSKQSME